MRVSTLLPGLPPSPMKANEQERNDNNRLEWNYSW
jgi:hypothetical protein